MKPRLIQLLKAFRPITVLLTLLLLLVSYSVISWKIESPLVFYLLALNVSLTAGYAMVINDYHDRFHDLKSGKTFAYKNQALIRNYACLLLGINLLLCTCFFFVNYKYGALSLALLAFSSFYSETRKCFLLSAITVATTAASVTLYAFMVQPTQVGLSLSVATFFFIGSREILKDIEDLENGLGYKATLPLKMGINKSKKIAGFLFLLSFLVLVLFVSPSACIGFPFLAFALYKLFLKEGHRKVKRFIDLTILFSLGAILIVSP